MMETKRVIISQGNRPLWQGVIAAMLYTTIIYLLFSFFTSLESGSGTKGLSRSLNVLKLAIFLLPMALAFSVVQDVHFDLEQRKYKVNYCIGPFGIGRWRILPEIQYVSVFKQPKKDGDFVFETNLWYQKNKHFNIHESTVSESAFAMGKTVAKILNVDLLDATEPNNYKWIETDDDAEQQKN